jgi:hypothetical protein
VLLFVGKDVDHNFEKDQQNQKQGWLFELECDKRTDYDGDVHDNDSFVRLEKKVLESNPLVFFIPYEVIGVGNPVADKEKKHCREKSGKGREIARKKNKDKNAVSEGEHPKMDDEEQDGARFLSNCYGFSPAVQFCFGRCPLRFGHLQGIEESDDDIFEPVEDHYGRKIPTEKKDTNEGHEVEENKRSDGYSEHGYILSQSMEWVNV